MSISITQAEDWYAIYAPPNGPAQSRRVVFWLAEVFREQEASFHGIVVNDTGFPVYETALPGFAGFVHQERLE